MILAKATIGSTITGPDDTTGVPAYLQPTWINKGNKILMDTKKQPLPHMDKVTPKAAKKSSAVVEQTDLLDIAGHMLGLIRAAGITPPADLFCLYQIYHETYANGKAFNSPLMLHYNASGIKFANQYGATQGPAPMHYAYFSSWEPYMANYKKILSKGANPLGATDLKDFAHRLKQNGYYEDTEENYYAGLLRAQAALKGFTTGAESYKKPVNKYFAWFMGLPWYGKAALIGGGLIVGKKIVS